MVALSPAGRERLDNVVANLTAQRGLPGFVLGATSADGELYLNSGGDSVLGDPTSGPIDHDAVFWICSMTKLIVHIAALQLIEQGRLSGDTPVSEYFPQFSSAVVVDDIMAPGAASKPAQSPVLVKHLINFTSGLYYPPSADWGIAMPPAYLGPHDLKDPHSEFFKLLQGDFPGVPLAFEPGTNFAYGYSADILGFIVEKITGKTLEESLQETIFRPLDIKASFYLTPDLEKRLFPLHFRRTDGKIELWDNQPGTKIIEHDYTKVARFLGGGGLYSSLRDYLKLLRHILQIHGGTAQRPILTKETVDALFVGTLDAKGRVNIGGLLGFMGEYPDGYSWSNALGTCEVDWPGRRRKGTGFWSGWAGTHFWIDPATGVAGVFGTQLSGLMAGATDPDVMQGLVAFEEALYANLA